AEVLTGSGLPYQAGPGESAFYGPKIDVQVADSSEREATLSTVQVDFYQPEQFDLHYTGADGARHRPVMVHRSIIGSMKRTVATLIERHGGAFPDWLAPEQLVVLPVTGALVPPAASLARQAVELGLRARVAGPESGTLGSRIRSARLVPYLAVIGDREAAAGQVALRLRDGRRLPALPADAALAGIAAHVTARRTGLWDAAAPPTRAVEWRRDMSPRLVRRPSAAREMADLFTRGSARPRRPRRGASGSAMCLRVGCRSAVLACGVMSWARKRAR